MPTPLDPDRLLRETFAAQVEYHSVLGSTNDRAKEYAAGRPGLLPLLIVADRQTAGRGRGSNRWWTGADALACSLLLDPRQETGTKGERERERRGEGEKGRRGDEKTLPSGSPLLPFSSSPLLSLAAGLAVARTVAPLLPDATLGIHWPNDVFAAGRKLAGILVEVVPENLHVIGIGLNTNNTIQDAPADVRRRAVTLRDLTGREHDHTEILRELLGHMETLLRQLGTAPEAIGTEADRLCLQRGQMLTLQRGRRTACGLCLGIAPDGALILDTPEGKRSFYSGVPGVGRIGNPSSPYPGNGTD
jgi:BirA family biotin operon repressor/biotin-[acetyl-CoA-carboxylase] ligase